MFYLYSLYTQPIATAASAKHTDEPAPEIRESYRIKWLELREKFPQAGVNDLRQQEARIYTWLYRHDQVWLSAHKPQRKSYQRPSDRVSWARRDQDLAAQISAVAS